MVAGNKNELEPWEERPFELIRQAEVHYRRRKSSDSDRRSALKEFDNSIEISIDAYLSQHSDQEEGKQNEQKKTRHFSQKLDFFMEEIKRRDLPKRISKDKIMHYHKQRNNAQHKSEYGLPGEKTLDGIRDAAMWVFDILFDTPDIEQKISRSIPNGHVELSVPVDPNISKALAIAALLGAWNEKNDADREVVKGLVNDFDQWTENLREDLQRQDSPLRLQNGQWRIPDRKSLWKAIAPRIFDDHLDQLKACAVEVLTERDPKFELPATERFAAAIHGKILKHSPALRQGMAESLALLGTCSDIFVHCSRDKLEFTSTAAVREILENADWRLWASLNDLLPTLAEAAPDEFLKIVGATLAKKTCPYDEMFAQEGDGWTGGSYITGMLWALEGLAWKKEYLGRVTVILAGLAARDPGGNLANRPINSLRTILLPWYPQTLAPIVRRIAAIKAIKLDFPKIAWQVLQGLLPSQHQTSLGAHKPVWLGIVSEDWEPKTTHKEYWEQVDAYSQFVVDMAVEDRERLGELTDNLDNLPQEHFDSVLKHLSSKKITNLSEEDRFPIWSNLTRFVRKHRRYPNAKWAFDKSTVVRIEDVAKKLAPATPERLYRRLFTNKFHHLYEGGGDRKDEHRKLEKKRRQAIREILEHSGIKGVIAFIDTVESPYQVGHSLAAVADGDIDSALLPQYFDAEDIRHKSFIGGFISGRHQHKGWAWVDTLVTEEWSLNQRCQFLKYLPFKSETWQRAKEWLLDDENRYWQQVDTIGWYPPDDDHGTAIDKLLEVNRPLTAIRLLCDRLDEKWLPPDTDRAVKALLAAVSTDEHPDDMTSYDIAELIKKLQDDPEVDKDVLCNVEWAYLRLLTSPGTGARPKYLAKRLATCPEFFSEVIQLLYRSKNENKPDGEADDSKKDMAIHAWHLLRAWKTPPGLGGNDFSTENFKTWLDKVKVQCTESGRLEVAMEKVGEVLFYCPPDPQGFWINQSVAEALNAENAGHMRNGFRIEIFNSRGAHKVDPTDERELAKQWRQKADEVDNMGYPRFAAELRRVADSYDRDAERYSRGKD